MGIITTYVCDVSGVQGPAEQFVKVVIIANPVKPGVFAKNNLEKLVHIDVARKLHLVNTPENEEQPPEPTLESKLITLLKEYMDDIAYNAAESALSNRN